MANLTIDVNIASGFLRGTRDDWSPEAREAAAKARKQQAAVSFAGMTHEQHSHEAGALRQQVSEGFAPKEHHVGMKLAARHHEAAAGALRGGDITKANGHARTASNIENRGWKSN
jgi:D-serine deaminase-like pyridoxal phosphate-dependent protein